MRDRGPTVASNNARSKLENSRTGTGEKKEKSSVLQIETISFEGEIPIRSRCPGGRGPR